MASDFMKSTYCNVNKHLHFGPWKVGAQSSEILLYWPYRNVSIFQICLIVLFQYFLSDLTRFVYPENILVDTRIAILCLLGLDTLLARLNIRIF